MRSRHALPPILVLALAACAAGGGTESVVASGAPAIESPGLPGARSYFVRILRTPEEGTYEARLRRARIGDSFAGVPEELVIHEMTKAAARVAAAVCAAPRLRSSRRVGRPLLDRRRDDPADERLLLLQCGAGHGDAATSPRPPRSSAQPEEGEDGDDHHDKADDVDHAVHARSPLLRIAG